MSKLSRADEARAIIAGDTTVRRYGNYATPPQLPARRKKLLDEKYRVEVQNEYVWKPKYASQERYYKKKGEWLRAYRRQLRREVIEAYGSKCACCGEGHWQFLTLDHPAGDGIADRKPHRNATGQFYGWVKKNNFPKTYRLLCMNCNWSQRHGWPCPHEEERLTADAVAETTP